MYEIAAVGLCWALFAGTHIGLTLPRIRRGLVARLGHWGFAWMFSGVAALCFSLLAYTYSINRFAGPPGLGLGSWPSVLPIAGTVIGLGLVLALSPFAGPTPATTTVLLRNQPIRSPHGLERVTRHPFFVGIGLFAAGHALIATHAVGVLFFAVLAVFSVGGAIMQDRKLSVFLGDPYRAYLGETSLLPFGAILAGRQRFIAAEVPWFGVGVALVLALGLRQVHASIFANGGLYVIAFVLGGAGFAMFRSRRSAASRLAATA